MTGPRFVPFESMSDAEQREHLERCHGIWSALPDENRRIHRLDIVSYVFPVAHTHDKPAPRPEENR